MSSSNPSWSTVLALTLAAASWGIGTVVSKRATAEIPPLTLLPIQLTASLVVLALFMRWRRMPFRDASSSLLLGRLGLLNPGLAYALSLLGLAHITASLSVLLWAMEPVLILFLAGWLLRERITASLVLLSLVAVAGMLLVINQPGSSGNVLGVGLTLAGVACCAIYTVSTRRWLGEADSTSQVLVAQQAYALAFAGVLAGAAWLVSGSVLPNSVTAAGWASAIGSGVLYYGVAYWLYLSGLRHVPASLAAVSFYLIPVFGVAAGFLILGERLGPGQWLGAGIVLAAIYFILRRTGTFVVDIVDQSVPAEA
jgi:drug/metabolite transporter (DMT)-like permease